MVSLSRRRQRACYQAAAFAHIALWESSYDLPPAPFCRHLLTFLQLRQPGQLFRAAVLLGQGALVCAD